MSNMFIFYICALILIQTNQMNVEVKSVEEHKFSWNQGEENQEKPKPPPAPSTAQVLQNENNTQENNQEMHMETLKEKIVEQEQVISQIQEEQKINENEINE